MIYMIHIIYIIFTIYISVRDIKTKTKLKL